jgi:regulator of sirC expression with transglutaminase-like and TPR domain
MTDSSQIEAALSLLDDPDPEVQRSVAAHLARHPDESVAPLRRLIDTSPEGPLLAGALAVLKMIGVTMFRRELARLLETARRDGEVDLESGVFAICYLRYPEIHLHEYTQQLDTMASLLEVRLQGRLSGLQLVLEINRYLVEELGFHGCRQEVYYDPENSFMNRVLDRRIGIPISLSVVYLLVAQRLRLPFHGVGFPTHFLIKYQSESEEFFIDPFEGGRILSRGDCMRFLDEIGMLYRPEFLEPISNIMTVTRMMNNLAQIYRQIDPDISVELEAAIVELGEVEKSEE